MPSKILIVDDEIAVRNVLGRVLRTRDQEVFFAADGREALEQAESVHPDLILLDLHLPGMNGLAVCNLLKLDTKTSRIPVLFVTGDGRIGAIDDALEQGAIGYILKPFDTLLLASKVEQLLQR